MQARRLANDGFAIAVNDSGDSSAAQKLAAELKAAGRQAITVQGDVTDPGDVENLFKRTLATFGGIDVVVHAAGIMPLRPIVEGHIATFDKVVAVNLRGAFLVLGKRRGTSLRVAGLSLFQAAFWRSLFPLTVRTLLRKRA